MTAQPISKPATPSAGATHTGMGSEHSGTWAAVVVTGAAVMLGVEDRDAGEVVGGREVGTARLLILVKMKGLS